MDHSIHCLSTSKKAKSISNPLSNTKLAWAATTPKKYQLIPTVFFTGPAVSKFLTITALNWICLVTNQWLHNFSAKLTKLTRCSKNCSKRSWRKNLLKWTKWNSQTRWTRNSKLTSCSKKRLRNNNDRQRMRLKRQRSNFSKEKWLKKRKVSKNTNSKKPPISLRLKLNLRNSLPKQKFKFLANLPSSI